MSRAITDDFFLLQQPRLDGVGCDLFDNVKEQYGMAVVESVIETAKEYMDEVVMVANFTMEELRIVLARQRRDYGIAEDYPVAKQASNIVDVIVENMEMERQAGKADYWLKK